MRVQAEQKQQEAEQKQKMERQMREQAEAQKLQKRAAKVGFDWPDVDGALPKIAEEAAEVRAAADGDDPQAVLASIRAKGRDNARTPMQWSPDRNAGFSRNRGLRIDHILVSNALKPGVQACTIDKLPRKNERPSDHAPVVVTLDLLSQI